MRLHCDNAWLRAVPESKINSVMRRDWSLAHNYQYGSRDCIALMPGYVLYQNPNSVMRCVKGHEMMDSSTATNMKRLETKV